MKVGEKIKARRKELGLSQEELASRVGYNSKAAISKIETNANELKRSRVDDFARALECSPGYLMGWDNAQPLSRKRPDPIVIENLTSNYRETNFGNNILKCDYTFVDDLNNEILVETTGNIEYNFDQLRRFIAYFNAMDSSSRNGIEPILKIFAEKSQERKLNGTVQEET